MSLPETVEVQFTDLYYLLELTERLIDAVELHSPVLAQSLVTEDDRRGIDRMRRIAGL